MNEQAKKTSQVEEQFANYEKAKGSFVVLLKSLEDRLSMVLRKSEEGVNLISKDEALTPLANEIRKIVSDMDYFHGRIKSILERLEI